MAEPRFLRSLAILHGWTTPRQYLSVDYAILPEQRLVSVRFCQKLSARGLETYAAALRNDPRFDPSFAELVDLRQVDEIILQPEDALRLADQVDPFDARSKRAFVVRTEVHMHYVRMHQLLRSGPKQIEIFPSLEEAKQWISK